MALDFLVHPVMGAARLSPTQRRILTWHALGADVVPGSVSTARPRGIFDNPLAQRGTGNDDADAIVIQIRLPANRPLSPSQFPQGVAVA